MKVIEYEEIKILRQSEKSTVMLVREKGGEKIFIKKILRGKQMTYSALQSCTHSYLPKLYEVVISDGATTVIEEYIEGESLGNAKLSEKQLRNAIKEICSVLGFLHEKGIIHRDIKPSNIIVAKDGHIRLIDFDAARMPKDDVEQDTKLLGTQGFASPEQYGFAQTDARTDIYSLGVTFEQLLGNNSNKLYNKRIIRKCTKLDPDKRYQSIKQMKRAFSYVKQSVVCGLIVVLLIPVIWYGVSRQALQHEQVQATAPVALPAPATPRWDGDTAVGLWGNVPNSGAGGEVAYHWRLYRQDTKTPPESNNSVWESSGGMRGNGGRSNTFPTYEMSFGGELKKNGFYYFEVSADGDGVNFSDSPYVISDAFEYTGEFAPPVPTPKGLEWKISKSDNDPQYYATWSNLDDYADMDSFKVSVYDKDNVKVVSNIMTKEKIKSLVVAGVWLNPDFITKVGGACRFTVQVQTSRPNEYKSSVMPDPMPEENFSPWYYTDN